MMIKVISYRDPVPMGFTEVNTTSRGSFKDLSPFYLGPITLLASEGYPAQHCLKMENLWQYSKVYPCHVNEAGFPTDEYFVWRHNGFNKDRVQRYPMGKGAKPLYSWWHGEHLDYITARKKIYIPVYRNLVLRTESYRKLYNWALQGYDIALRDFDGYDHVSQNMTLQDVIDNPKRPMGHAFIIYGLLTGGLDNG